MAAVNHGDDFLVSLNFKMLDDVNFDIHTAQFTCTYSDSIGNTYPVSYDGVTRVNNYPCTDHDGNKIIVVVFENYALRRGALSYTLHLSCPNEHFSDGIQNFTTQLISNVVLI